MNEAHAYARWLAWGARLGLAFLLAAFLVYLLGVLPARVPIENLPEHWALSAAEYVERADIATGWGWLRHAGHGDILNIVGIAILAGCSLPPLAAVIGAFRASGERAFAWICVAEILVLLLAASGFVSLH